MRRFLPAPLRTVREQLDQLVRDALRALAEREGPAELAGLDPGLERARDPLHGDFASNVAMRAAKIAGKPPRELAQAIIDCLPDDPRIGSTELAGPGFINFRLTDAAYQAVLREILRAGSSFGRAPANTRGKVLIEYLSANPTGPLHVGHGRHAAFGATLVEILRAAGYAVEEEYYINDAGRQMDILAASVWLRYAEIYGALDHFPRKCYQGAYVRSIAEKLGAEHGESCLGDADSVSAAVAAFGDDDEKNLDSLIAAIKSALGERAFALVFNAALDEVLGDIKNDLEEFGAAPTRWFSERSLVESGAVDAALALLRGKGLLYERDGPTWFRTTDFGDDKDRVVVRENGVPTYLASDIAYHIEKFDRGYDSLINVLGSDHHGYIGRLKAAVAAVGNDPDRLEFRLVQFVVLYRGKQKVQMSTRSGEYVTLRELRNEVGNDAARFFYVSRSNDQHLEFDLELAKAQTSDNPVYYVQYAHARVASMLSRHEGSMPDAAAVDLGLLSTEAELALMRSLSRYPEIVELAANGRAPQHIVHYLRDLAAAFHAYYNAHRILTDETALRDARVLLAVTTQQVIRNGLGLLGVTAPESM
jgi:arginyl-tRNA synthetase